MMTRPGSRRTTDPGRRDEDALRLLGLARRGGSAVPGVAAVRDLVRRGRALVVIVAKDAAAGQVGKVVGVARARSVPVVTLAERESLGRAVGAPPTSVVTVTERGIAEQLLRRLSGSGRDPDESP